MCISNIGNRRPFPTNGFRSRGDAVASTTQSMSTIDTSLLKTNLNNGGSKNHHIIVQHCYHDHSHDNRVDYQEDQPVRGGVTVPFPLKLHDMLNSVAANGHEHIVSWQPHGRCFVVHKPKEFIELLPQYFKLSKLASFQRQLNLYGFQRLTRGRDRGGYYHELFLKDRVFLAHSIQRIKVKGTGIRARSNPDQEPDFWSMEWVSGDNTATSSSSCDNNNNNGNMMINTKLQQQNWPMHMQTLQMSPSFFSQQMPLNLEPTALPPDFSLSSSLQQKQLEDEYDDEDDVLFGKHFFDVEKILSHHHQQQQQQPLAAAATPSPSAEEQADPLPLDDYANTTSEDEILLNEEEFVKDAESFFEDFDFPDEDLMGSADIEDDAVFGQLLEQMIS